MTVSAPRPLRRRSTLLGSSMLNTAAIAAMAAVGAAMVPGEADAFACSPVGTALYCNGPVANNSASGFSTVDLGAAPPNGTGVAYTATGTQTFTNIGTGNGITVTLENNGSNINTATGDGLDIGSDHPAILHDFGSITATAGAGVDIETTTSTGLIGATVGADVNGQNYGVIANAAGAADVLVNVIGTGTDISTTAAGGAGISATSDGGGVVVSATSTGGQITGGSAIEAENIGGGARSVTVFSSEVLTGTRGDGILATSNGSGFVAVGYNVGTSTAEPITGVAQATSLGDGINAVSTGTGDVLVYTGFAQITGAGAGHYGINATAAGATANVTVNAADTSISGVDEGINAQGVGSGTVTVESTLGPVSGSNGDGIFAKNASGTINIGLALNPITTGTTMALGITGDNGNGIFARTTAGGAINAYIGTGLITGQDGNGLWLDGENGGNISLNANGSQFVGREAGIEADTFGSGTVTIAGTNIAALGGVGSGIGATSQNGDINIGSSTNRLTTGVGIDANISSTGGDGVVGQSLGSGSVSIYAGAGVFASQLTTSPGAGIAALVNGAGNGNALVDLSGSIVQGGFNGVTVGNLGSGSSTFNAVGAFITGSDGKGVVVDTSSATANVNFSATDTAISGKFAGIFAYTQGAGTVTILDTISPGAHIAGTAGVVHASNGDAIYGASATGTVNLGTALNPLLTNNDIVNGITGLIGNGIVGQTTTGGAINLYTAGGLVTGTDNDGADLQGGTGAIITVLANNTGFDGAANGLEADTSGTGTVTIGGTKLAASATTGDGVIALTQNGDVNIGTSGARLTTGAGLGANILSVGGDGLVGATLGNGSVNIYLGAGVYQSELNAAGGAGVAALGETAGGTGNLLVDLSGSSVQGNYDGVDVLTKGSGAVTFNGLGAFITGAGHRGLDIETGGATAGVSVNVTDSAISGEFAGIFASDTGSGTVTVLDTISPGAHLVGTAGVVHASNGDGLYAASGSGTVNIGTALNPLLTNNDAVNGITGIGGNGIAGKTTTGGAINLYIAGGLVTGTDGDGAFLDGGPGAVMTVAATNTSFNGSQAGLEADTSGAGTVTVNSTGGAITGAQGAGIVTNTQNGLNSVGTSGNRITTGLTQAAGVGSTLSDGIGAASFGTGGVNIFTGAGLFYSGATVTGSGAIVGESTAGGAVDIDLLGSTVQGGFDAVAGETFGATLTVNAVGGNLTATNGSGIDAVTHIGDIDITAGDSVINGNAGINAVAMGTGNVTVLNTISPGLHAAGTAGVIQSDNDDAIFAQTTTGTVNLGTAVNPLVTGTTAATGITSQFADGVAATAGAGGAINLYSGAGLITGGSGDGADLQGATGVNIVVNAAGTSYLGRSRAIDADTLGTGTVTIASVGGALTGGTVAGVDANTVDGAINIGSAATRISTGSTLATGVTGDSYAIHAVASGAGAVNVYAGAGFYISNNTMVLGSVGIEAASVGGAVTVDLSGSKVVSYDAVLALSGNGLVTVNELNAETVGERNGLEAFGPGIVDVTLGAGELVAGATGHGVVVSSGVGGASLQFSGSSTAATLIEATGGAATAAVDVAQITGASTVIANNAFSTLKSINGHFSDLAIHASGTTGSVRIGNTGVIDGEINLGGLTDAGASAATSSSTLVNNLTGGIWNTAGTDTFGAGGVNGADTLLNGGGIGTSGAVTTFAFGAATANSFTNSGTLVVGEAVTGSPQPYASSLVINHLQTFNNSGMIVLGDGAATPERSLTAAGAAFTGSGAGTVQLDAQLGGAGSTADTLNVGSTAGATSILIRDVNAGVSGNTGPAGITLVTTTGANAQTVTLNPGSSDYQLLGANAGLVKGLFFYSLVQQPTATLLVSALDADAYDFTYLTSGAQQIWYATAPWQDRQADLRDTFALDKGDTGSFEPGLWMKAIGDWADRTASVTPMPGFTFDTSYLQDTSGVIGGLDGVHHGLANKDDEALFGVSTGYVSSTMDFESGSTRAQYEGWTGGLYATYLNGPFFLDGDVKGDALKLSIKEPGTFDGNADANSLGGQVESGLRLPVGSMTLEPVGSLAYVKTHIGDYVVSGTTVRIGDNDSFRGSLGLRLSTDLVSNDHLLLKLAGDARVWDEFASGNKTAFLSSGPEIDVTDPIKGAFGETGLSLNLYSRDGHTSGFFNTSIKFKSGYTDSKIGLGFRYQWGGAH